MSFIDEHINFLDEQMTSMDLDDTTIKYAKQVVELSLKRYKAKVDETLTNAILSYNPEDTQYTREKSVMVNAHLEQLQRNLQEL